jgi:uncharacterized protein (TIGR03435 family)
MTVRAEGGPGTPEPERYTVENMDFAGLVMFAYGIRRDQISGPDWMTNERYNIAARVPPGATKAQFRTMLQNLLAERFALKVHWGSKEMPIYNLVVMKGGARLKESEPEVEGSTPPRKPVKGPAGFPELPPGGEPGMSTISGNGKATAAMRGRRETAAEIAVELSHQLGHTVRDATGLQGRYDYTLYWVISSRGGAASAVPTDANGASPPAEESPGPTLREAIEEQLGLKLEPARGSVEILVVDRVNQKPVDN